MSYNNENEVTQVWRPYNTSEVTDMERQPTTAAHPNDTTPRLTEANQLPTTRMQPAVPVQTNMDMIRCVIQLGAPLFSFQPPQEVELVGMRHNVLKAIRLINLGLDVEQQRSVSGQQRIVLDQQRGVLGQRHMGDRRIKSPKSRSKSPKIRRANQASKNV